LPTGQTKRRVPCAYTGSHSTGDSEPRAPPPSSVNITSDSLRVASVSESPAQCEWATHDSGARTNSTSHHKHQGADQCHRSENYTFSKRHICDENGKPEAYIFCRHHPPTCSLGRTAKRSGAAKSNQWRQHVCRSLSHPLPEICRHLPPYDTDDCRNVLRFVAVAMHIITIQINSVRSLPDSLTTP